MAKKYLDENGLLYVWQKIKDKFVWQQAGKGLSTNDYTTTEKNKLAGVEEGATKTTIDATLSSTSTNPVQNKVVNSALAGKVDVVSGKGLSTNDYTTAEKTKLSGIAEGANKTIINNTLTSTSTTEALSAAQGKVLDEKIAAINTNMEDLGAGDMLKSVYDTNSNGIVDNAEKLGGNAPSYYAKASDIPTVPTNVSDFTNDAGYITASEIPTDYVTESELSGKGYATTAQVTAVANDVSALNTRVGDASNLVLNKNNVTASLKALYDLHVEFEEDITATVNGKADKSAIPTNNNQLTNGAGYQTAAQVNAAIEAVVGAAPDALNTLDELAQALGDDANFASTVTTELAKKVNDADLIAITNDEIDHICWLDLAPDEPA